MLIWVVLCLVLAPAYAEEDSTNCCGRPDKQRFIYRVSEYNCPCSAHTTGILRYHDNHIQYCNGKEFVPMGVATPRVLGSKENPAKSCPHILEEVRLVALKGKVVTMPLNVFNRNGCSSYTIKPAFF